MLLYPEDFEDLPLEIQDLVKKDLFFKDAEYRDRYRGLQRLRQQQRSVIRVPVAVRRRMHLAQKGLCAICGQPETAGRRRLAADHNHATSKLRALLCTGCNLTLGLMHEDPARLRAAALYLEKHK